LFAFPFKEEEPEFLFGEYGFLKQEETGERALQGILHWE